MWVVSTIASDLSGFLYIRFSEGSQWSSYSWWFQGDSLCKWKVYKLWWGYSYLIGITSSPSQRVVPCSVAEMDAALQHHITSGAVVICTSTAQEARRLLQVNWQCSSPSSLSPSSINTQAQTSLVPRPSPSFPMFNHTASDGKLGEGLETRLAQNFRGISWDSVLNTLSLMMWPTHAQHSW